MTTKVASGHLCIHYSIIKSLVNVDGDGLLSLTRVDCVGYFGNKYGSRLFSQIELSRVKVGRQIVLSQP